MTTARDLAARFGNILDPALRSVIGCGQEAFKPYDRYGTPPEGMFWRPLSVGQDDDLEIFLVRMEPGAQSLPHEHVGEEQFLVLEGSIRDCDGAVIAAGSFARYEAGSTHHSTTDEGCLLLVVLRSRNRGLDA